MNVHVQDRIAAYLDGQLSDAEAATLRSHVASCEACATVLRQSEEAIALLEADAATQPLASMWPEVASRLGRRLPVFDLPFATATAVALTAGVMIGVLTFDRTQPVVTGGDVAATTDGWSTDGEVLLADVYLTSPAAETVTP